MCKMPLVGLQIHGSYACKSMAPMLADPWHMCKMPLIGSGLPCNDRACNDQARLLREVHQHACLVRKTRKHAVLRSVPTCLHPCGRLSKSLTKRANMPASMRRTRKHKWIRVRWRRQHPAAPKLRPLRQPMHLRACPPATQWTGPKHRCGKAAQLPALMLWLSHTGCLNQCC